jgi:hypothetical protein
MSHTSTFDRGRDPLHDVEGDMPGQMFEQPSLERYTFIEQ